MVSARLPVLLPEIKVATVCALHRVNLNAVIQLGKTLFKWHFRFGVFYQSAIAEQRVPFGFSSHIIHHSPQDRGNWMMMRLFTMASSPRNQKESHAQMWTFAGIITCDF